MLLVGLILSYDVFFWCICSNSVVTRLWLEIAGDSCDRNPDVYICGFYGVVIDMYCSYFLMFLEYVICDILFTCLIRTRVGDCLYEHMRMWSRFYAMQYHRRLSRFMLVTTKLLTSKN